MPSIFGQRNAGQIVDALDNDDTAAYNLEEEKGADDLEISDEEAPDLDAAKKNLRSQAEKKRKNRIKKTTVQGVHDELVV